MRAVFLIAIEKWAEASELLKEDQISRQSITSREASTLGLSEKGHVLIIEGQDVVVRKATELLQPLGKTLPPDQEQSALARLREQEEDAAQGLGSILGGS